MTPHPYFRSPFFSLVLAVWCAVSAMSSASERPVPIELTQGPTKIHLYQKAASPVAAIVFASGDGGWTEWEDRTCEWLADKGWWVAGLNCRAYAKAGDYDRDRLSEDFRKITRALRVPEGTAWYYGGWSMGAVQAVAAASRPDDNLKGLLLISCGSRGRYGLRLQDEMGLSPEGPGTFGLKDFNAAVKGLRIAQFQGGSDLLSSTAWAHGLPGTVALYELPGYNHGFNGPAESFKPHLYQGLDWLLGDESQAPVSTARPLPFGLSPFWPAALVSIVLTLIFLFSRKHAIRLLIVAVVVMGATNLMEALVPKSADVAEWMEQWLPLGISEDSRLLLFLSGICLLGLARGLRRYKKTAWWLAVCALAGSAVLHLARAFDWHHALAAIVLLIPLIRWRNEFTARSDAPSVRIGVIAAPLILAALVIYGTVTIHHLGEAGKIPEAIDWDHSAKAAFLSTIGSSGTPDTSEAPELERFLNRLGGAGLGAATLILVLLLRPVLARRGRPGDQEERLTAARILETYGCDPSDPFTLLEDKRYFFHPSGEGYVAYALWRDMAVALADPVCPENLRAELIREFLDFCKRQDWTPLFYGTGSHTRQLYERAGMITFKVGEDARIPLGDFTLSGGKFQNLRTARNKAGKEGFSFAWYSAAASVDHGLEAQLHLLSDAWLHSKSGGEMTFDLGRFSLTDIRERGCAVVYAPDGRVECFATWIPYAQGKGRTLDLMRGRGASGIMDFLILESIDRFKKEGVEEISLGNAPLANTERDPDHLSTAERRVKLLFDRFDRFYRYKSLFEFKRKYHPAWRGRYLAYPPGTLLARIGLAVAAVHLPGGFRSLLKS